MFRVGRIEVRRALRRRQVQRVRRHHREARFGEGEAVEIKRTGDEWPGVAAELLDIGVGRLIGWFDDAAKPRIIIARERRVRREGFGDTENLIEPPGELVDHHDRALLFADAAKLRLHVLFQ